MRRVTVALALLTLGVACDAPVRPPTHGSIIAKVVPVPEAIDAAPSADGDSALTVPVYAGPAEIAALDAGRIRVRGNGVDLSATSTQKSTDGTQFLLRVDLVPVGSGYEVVVEGLKAGEVVFRGTASGVSVTGGTTPTTAPIANFAVFAPSNLTATTASATQINLAWSDVTGETSYQLQRCTGASCTIFAAITSTATNVATYQNTGLTSGSVYRYRVRAINGSDTSGYSNLATAVAEPLTAALVVITPAGATVAGVGATQTFTAEARTASGSVIGGKSFAWASLNPNVATMNGSTGVATAVTNGQTTVSASVDGVTGYALLTASLPGLAPVNLWSPVPGGTNEVLFDVWGVSGTDLYAVGATLSSLGTYVHFDGTNWSAVEFANYGNLYGVWGASASDVYAVGVSGTILHYDGTRSGAFPVWSNMTNPGGGTFYDVWGTSPRDVYVTHQGLLHFDGTSWTTVNGVSGPIAIWGASASDIFAGGDNGAIYRYNGSAWTTMASQTTNNIHGIWGTSPNDVYAVGSNGTGSGGSIHHFDGTAWTEMTNPLGAGNGDFIGVWGTSPSDVYVLGASGVLLRYNGTSWISVTSGTNQHLYAAFGSGADVFIVGGAGGPRTILRGYRGATVAVTPATPTLSVSATQQMTATARDAGNNVVTGLTNSGYTWSATPGGIVTVSSSGLVTALASGSATVTATAPGGAGGNTTVTVGQATVRLQFTPQSWDIGIIGDTRTIGVEAFDVSDNPIPGRTYTWTSLNPAVATVNASGVITTVSTGQVTIKGVTDDGFTGYVMVNSTRNTAPTPVNLWAPVSIGATGYLNEVWGTAANDVFAVGDDGQIFHYNGTAWSPMTSNTTADLYGVWGTGPNHVVAVGENGTVDRFNGSTWTTAGSPGGSYLYHVWGTAPNDIVAVGSAGTVQRFNGTQWTGSSISAEDLFGVWGSGPANSHAVGRNGVMYRWDGQTWTRKNQGLVSVNVLAVWGPGGNINHRAVGEVGTALRYDGTNWLLEPTGISTVGLLSVWGSSSLEAYAVGVGGTDPILRFNGSAGTWQQMTVNFAGVLEGVWGTHDGDLWAVGSGGTVLRGVRGATVSVTPATPTLTSISATQQMTATARDAGNNPVSSLSNSSFTWSANPGGIVTVNASGLVTALANGSTSITANAPGGAAGSTLVTVSATFGGSMTPTSADFGDTVVAKAGPITWDGDETITVAGRTPFIVGRGSDSIAFIVPDVPVGAQSITIGNQGPNQLTQFASLSVLSTFVPNAVPASAPDAPTSFPAEFYVGLEDGAANHYLRVAPAGDQVLRVTLEWQTAANLDIRWCNATCSSAEGNADGATTANPEVSAVQMTAGADWRLRFHKFDGGTEPTTARVRIELLSDLGQSVATGGFQSCALDANGAAWCWGMNGRGQLGDGTQTQRSSPVQVAGGHVFSMIDGGTQATCGLVTAGGIYCWGSNSTGQLGADTVAVPHSTLPLLVPGGRVYRTVSIGSTHVCGVEMGTDDAFCWGSGQFGQIGNGSTSSSTTPQLVSGGLNFLAISAGTNHTCGVEINGTVYCWGSNSSGQLGTGATDPDPHSVPSPVPGAGSMRAVSAGASHTCGIEESTDAAYCWGSTGLGQLGNGTTSGGPYGPVLVMGGHAWRVVSTGSEHSCGVTMGSVAYCWGRGSFGQLGNGLSGSTFSASPVVVSGGGSYEYISAGLSHTCAGTAMGELRCWGRNGNGQLGDGVSPGVVPAQVSGAGSGFTSIAVGVNHACGINSLEAYCWGLGTSGQLGDGTFSSSTTPVAVSGGVPFEVLSAGFMHTCGLDTLGAAYCWGSNGGGRLGDSTRVLKTVPTAVYGGRTFSAISAGTSHTCALESGTGDAYCWGNNGVGQLGTGVTNIDSIAPVIVTGGMEFQRVSTSQAPNTVNSHTCAIEAVTGAAYCWGLNASSELGDGSTINRSSPTAVLGGALSFGSIAAGALHTCGLTTGGAGYCWGAAISGQLGGGQPSDALVSSPAPVLGGYTFSAIDAGPSHTCGVATGGAAYCWGRNFMGQLGNGAQKDSLSTPQAVIGGLSFFAVELGLEHSCGVTIGDVAYCWGESPNGQLGNGTMSLQSVPVTVTGGVIFQTPPPAYTVSQSSRTSR